MEKDFDLKLYKPTFVNKLNINDISKRQVGEYVDGSLIYF